MWLGGALATMVGGMAAKWEDRQGLGAIVRSQTALYRKLIAPGALLTVFSGLILTFAVSGSMGDSIGFNLWLVIMQGAGILAALLVLLIALPTAVKLSRITPTGAHAEYFDELRQRQRVVGSIAGVLGLVALVAGAFVR